MLDALNLAYATLEKYNVSVTSLIVISIILALAFLFAVREAAAWFFKIDAIKKDVKDLRRTIQMLEEQVRTLSGLVERARQSTPTPPSPEPEKKTAPLKGAAQKETSQFPIVH